LREEIIIKVGGESNMKTLASLFPINFFKTRQALMEVIMHANLTSILIHNSTFDHDFSIVTILLILLGLKDHSGW
jgi:hypothetical protein